MMNAEATFPMFFVIALAVGAGLLAVLVLWLSKQIANEKTRGLGIAMAVITVCVLILGWFVTGTTVHQRPAVVTPVPPMATMSGGETTVHYPGVVTPSDSARHVHVHPQHPPPHPAAVGPRLAWAPITITAIAVAVIVLLITSRKGLAAALAGLGIVGAVLVMILYAARDARVQQVAEARMSARSEGNWAQELVKEAKSTPGAVVEVTPRDNGTVTVTETWVDPADNKSDADKKAKAEREAIAEASSTTVTEATNPPAPAWINDEPTMEDGVYRAVVVSGPYSTKRECEAHLTDELRQAMMEYADSHLRPSARYAAWVDIGYVRNNMIEERHFAHDQYNVAGKMYNLHVRLKVEPRDVARFNALAHEYEVRSAVESASLGGVFVFGALVVLYGGLRFVGRKKPTVPADTPPTATAEPTA